MPTYDYHCPRCGAFDALRPLSQRDQAADCPACGQASPRVFASAAPLALSGGGARAEPSNGGGYARLKHAAGCGCCRPARGRAVPGG